MLFNKESLVGAITAFTLLSSVNGRALFPRNDFCATEDIVNSNGQTWNGSASQLYESSFHLRDNLKASPLWLRILPLGASITQGSKSSPQDGYRKELRAHLKSLGHNINMVGSRTNEDGSMPDGQHEGVPGARIDEIYSYMDKSLDSKPNVYLINAGTNDCQQNHLKMNGTIGRMNDLLTKARAVSTKATIILSTLTPSFNGAGANQRVNLLNIEIRELAAKLRKDGISIVLAEMNDGFLSKPDFNADGIHPTNDGYKKMAAVWTAAILEAREAGMLQDPEDNGQDDDVPMIN